MCTLLSFSPARGARPAVIAANDDDVRADGGAKPAIAAVDRSLHLSKLHGAPSSGTDELIVYHNSWFHRWLITEEIGSSEASLGWKVEGRSWQARRQSEDERSCESLRLLFSLTLFISRLRYLPLIFSRYCLSIKLSLTKEMVAANISL